MNSHPTVSAIVPARNEEATIAAAVESLAAQPEIREIIVVNDQSTDRTAGVLQKLSSRYPQVRVLETGNLPEGWVGKNYAVSLGAAQAAGDWLLFTDADGVHLPGSTARALADAAANGAGLVSYSPEQETRTWWEKSLIPFVYTRLAHKFSYAEVSDPESPAAAASGQYLLIRRKEYERIGGHAAVGGEVLEDVALARLAKRAGVKLYFASGYGIMRVRMYRTFAAMWQGWTKNLYPLMGGTTLESRGESATEVPVGDAVEDEPRRRSERPSRAVGRELLRVVPWIPLLMLFPAVLHPIWGAPGVILLAGRHAAYAGDLRRNRFPASLALYYLSGVALYGAALLNSEWHYVRGTVAWKGREYQVNSRRS
jgi:glycosyl transferase family 2